MAIRYFCDNCGTETRSSDLTVLMISIPPQAETFDVCPACATRMTSELERCRETKQQRELLPTPSGDGDSGGALERYATTVLDLPGVRPLVRTASYAAIFVAFFAALTFFTAVR